jgi:hypothetical protein
MKAIFEVSFKGYNIYCDARRQPLLGNGSITRAAVEELFAV